MDEATQATTPTVASQPSRRRAAKTPGRRQQHYNVRVTPVEDAMLRRMAQVRQVSVARLLLENTLDTRPDVVTRADIVGTVDRLGDVSLKLAGVARNMNQIAHAANIEHVVANDFDTVLAETMRVLQLVRGAMKGLDQS